VKPYVLDSTALMVFFENRPGAGKVEELLQQAGAGDQPLWMSVVSWGEVYYTLWRGRGERSANEIMERVAQLPIQLVDVDAPMTKAAATLKTQFNLPYLVCLVAGLASLRSAAIVTSDPEFKPLKGALDLVVV
jgi:PIN domain nuclease of toxin-antitoxin system